MTDQAMPGATPDGATKKRPRRNLRKRIPAHMRNARGEAKTGGKKRGPPVNPARIAEVQDMREMLFPDNDIVRLLSKKHGVAGSTIRADIVRVQAAWDADPIIGDPKASRERASRTAMRMFRRSLGKGDEKTAQKYFQDYCRIVGVYVPDALKLVALDGAALANLSEGELDAAIAREFERLGVPMPAKGA